MSFFVFIGAFRTAKKPYYVVFFRLGDINYHRSVVKWNDPKSVDQLNDQKSSVSRDVTLSRI